MIGKSLLVSLLVVLAAGIAAAHDAQPLFVTMALDEVELMQQISIRADLFDDWSGLDARAVADALENDDPAAKKSVEDAFAEWVEVEIDGIRVRPILRNLVAADLDIHGIVFTYVDMTVFYGVKGRPRQVSFVWKRFDTSLSLEVSPIDAELEAFGELGYAAFRRSEPQHLWHAPLVPRESPGTRERPEVSTRATFDLPVVSAVLAGLALLALPLLLLWREGRRHVGRFALGLLVLSAGLSDLTRTRIELPWEASIVMPDEEGAKAIFESLHRNVYRAFDYTDQEAVYDTLAQSVEGDLLDELYVEVKEGLILRDQGGAVSRVRNTRILEADVTLSPDPDERRFEVESLWVVTGTVEHWAHKHIRVNEYSARFGVRWQGDGWKIATVEILDQKRVPVSRGG